MTCPTSGDRATCAQCGAPIVFDDPTWVHVGEPQPRHIATPLKLGATAVPALRAEARRHGYALALHGSGQRDLDLVAVPWVAEVSPPTELAEALRAAVGGFIVDATNAPPGDYTQRSPEPKPHSRLAWSIHLRDDEGRRYIDLSVIMPTPERALLTLFQEAARLVLEESDAEDAATDASRRALTSADLDLAEAAAAGELAAHEKLALVADRRRHLAEQLRALGFRPALDKL